jgi:hypothetical protein
MVSAAWVGEKKNKIEKIEMIITKCLDFMSTSFFLLRQIRSAHGLRFHLFLLMMLLRHFKAQCTIG